MNTPPPSPARSVSHTVPQPSRSSSEPPRQQAERQNAKDRFASKMEREEGGKPSQNRDAGASSGADGLLSGSRLLQERGTGDGSGSGFAQRELQLQLAGAQNNSGTAATGGSSLDMAQLQRMAAQIAEGALGTKASEASIQFPDGALAESAQIKREPDGSIAIRIAGMDPRMSALQNGRAQIELLNGLALRRLRVSSLTLERSKADPRAENGQRDSAISRVV